jgi:hypothetical protein
MTTRETLRSEVIRLVRERLNSYPHHQDWSKTQRLTYELGYVTGILISLAEQTPSLQQELMTRLSRPHKDQA